MRSITAPFAAPFAAVVLFLALSGALPAQQPSASSSPTVAGWQTEIQRVDGLLRAGSWEDARGAAGALVDELIRNLKGGPDGARLLATAYAQRALAEAGIGDLGEAVWSLAIASALDPGFADAPLDGFGTAGERLGTWRREDDPGDPLPLDTPGLVPPAVVESPTIVFRASEEVLRGFDYSLQVELVVDAAGRPRRPLVFGSRDNPAPIAASLEVLHDWVFQPATQGGRPVPALLALDLPLTTAAATRARLALEDLRSGAGAPAPPPPGGSR
jgi:hypothetical protein